MTGFPRRLLAACTSCLLSSGAMAGNATPAATTPNAVELFLVPDGFATSTRITEAMLPRIACRYWTDDAALVSALMRLALAARAHPRETAATPTQFEVRGKLVFEGAAGATTVISYSQAFSNVPDLMASWDGASVHLERGFKAQVSDAVRQAHLPQLNPMASQYCLSNANK